MLADKTNSVALLDLNQLQNISTTATTTNFLNFQLKYKLKFKINLQKKIKILKIQECKMCKKFF